MVLFCIWCNSNKITSMCLFLCFFFNLTIFTLNSSILAQIFKQINFFQILRMKKKIPKFMSVQKEYCFKK